MNCKNKSFMTKKKAFTLIELLIVIAIIGILFIVLVSKVDFATDKAKTTGVQTDFRSFQLAFETVATENAGFTSLITTDYEKLEAAINKNLDNKLKIDIDAMGKISMLNGTSDPWNTEYHGDVVVGQDGMDRGAIVLYSNGPNMQFGSHISITGGVASIAVINENGKDDFAIVSCYSFNNGTGKVHNTTVGFSNNQGINNDDIVSSGKQYLFLNGENFVYQTNSALVDVVFRVDANAELFSGVAVDGKALNSTNYTVASGSTIVILKDSYVNSLSTGEHVVTILFDDGYATTNLHINNCVHESLDETDTVYLDLGNNTHSLSYFCHDCYTFVPVEIMEHAWVNYEPVYIDVNSHSTTWECDDCKISYEESEEHSWQGQWCEVCEGECSHPYEYWVKAACENRGDLHYQEYECSNCGYLATTEYNAEPCYECGWYYGLAGCHTNATFHCENVDGKHIVYVECLECTETCQHVMTDLICYYCNEHTR